MRSELPKGSFLDFWEDFVLPKDPRELLRMVSTHVEGEESQFLADVLFEMSRIPTRLIRNLRLLGPCQRRELQTTAIMKALGGFYGDGSVILAGEPGVGKSTVAVDYATYCIHNGHYVFFVNWPLVMADMKARLADGRGIGRVIRAMQEAPMLIIDDFGRDRGSEWTKEVSYLVVEARYSNLRQTIFTTNLNEAQMAEYAGPAVVSRMAEMCEKFEFSHKTDRRRRAK